MVFSSRPAPSGSATESMVATSRGWRRDVRRGERQRLIFGVTLGWVATICCVSVFDDSVEGLEYLISQIRALVLKRLAIPTRIFHASTVKVLRRNGW